MIQSSVLYKFLSAQSAGLPSEPSFDPHWRLENPKTEAFQMGSKTLLQQLESMLKPRSLESVTRYFEELKMWLTDQDDNTQACFVEAMSLMGAEPGQEPRPDQVQHSGIMYAQQILIDLITLAATQGENAEVAWPETSMMTGTTVVFTAHPSQARNHRGLLLLGQLELIVRGGKPTSVPVHIPHTDSSHALLDRQLLTKASRIFDEIWKESPFIAKPTVPQEVSNILEYTNVMAESLRELEQKLGVEPGKAPIAFHTWAGTEADRNAVTPWVQLHSMVQYSRYSVQFYTHQLSNIKEFLETNKRDFARFAPPVLSHLNGIIALLEGHHKQLNTIYATAQSMAAVEVFDLFVLQGKMPNEFPEHVQHNLVQLFPDYNTDPKIRLEQVCEFVLMKRSMTVDRALVEEVRSIIQQKFVSSNSLKLSGDGARHFKTFIEGKRALYAARIQTQLKPVYTAFLADMTHLKEDLMTKLREFGKVDDAQKIGAQIDTMISRHSYFGFHGLQGQWRLDSDALKQAVEGIMSSQDVGEHTEFASAAPAGKCAAILKRILNPATDKIDLDQIEAPAYENIVNYFKVQSWAQKADSKHAPVLVIANAHSASDFMYAFYLAVKTGQIQVQDGKVVGAPLVWIMPLLESVQDHDEGAKMFKELLSIPLIRSYFEQLRHVGYMKAYSDTARDDGTIGAVDRLLRTPYSMYAVYQNAFRYDLTELERLTALGMLTSNKAIQELWELILSGRPEDEIHAKWKAIPQLKDKPMKRRAEDDAHPKPRWREQHGIGSVYHRSGGSGMDVEFRRGLAGFERRDALTTLQPGLLERWMMNPDRALDYLLQELIASAAKGDEGVGQAAPMEARGQADFFAALKEFVDPSIPAYHQQVKSKDGLLNQWLINNPLAWIIINTMSIGSRGKPPQDLRSWSKGLVELNRAISVSAILERTGFKFNVVGPFVEMIKAYQQRQGGEMTQLREWYQTSPHFRLMIHKIEEGFLRSDLIGLRQMLGESGAKLYATCEANYREGLTVLQDITGTETRLDVRPEVQQIINRENWIRRKFISNFTALVKAVGHDVFMTTDKVDSGPQLAWRESVLDSNIENARQTVRIIMKHAGPGFGYG